MNNVITNKNVFLTTFGCQMNEYDSELVRAIMAEAGYEFTDDEAAADIVMLNTCSVRENAHNKVYGHIHEIRHRRQGKPVLIGVLGCMATGLRRELSEDRKLALDFVVGPDSYKLLPEIIRTTGPSPDNGLYCEGPARPALEEKTKNIIRVRIEKGESLNVTVGMPFIVFGVSHKNNTSVIVVQSDMTKAILYKRFHFIGVFMNKKQRKLGNAFRRYHDFFFRWFVIRNDHPCSGIGYFNIQVEFVKCNGNLQRAFCSRFRLGRLECFIDGGGGAIDHIRHGTPQAALLVHERKDLVG